MMASKVKSPRLSLAERLERSRQHRRRSGHDSSSVGGSSFGEGGAPQVPPSPSRKIPEVESVQKEGQVEKRTYANKGYEIETPKPVSVASLRASFSRGSTKPILPARSRYSTSYTTTTHAAKKTSLESKRVSMDGSAYTTQHAQSHRSWIQEGLFNEKALPAQTQSAPNADTEEHLQFRRSSFEKPSSSYKYETLGRDETLAEDQDMKEVCERQTPDAREVGESELIETQNASSKPSWTSRTRNKNKPWQRDADTNLDSWQKRSRKTPDLSCFAPKSRCVEMTQESRDGVEEMSSRYNSYSRDIGIRTDSPSSSQVLRKREPRSSSAIQTEFEGFNVSDGFDFNSTKSMWYGTEQSEIKGKLSHTPQVALRKSPVWTQATKSREEQNESTTFDEEEEWLHRDPEIQNGASTSPDLKEKQSGGTKSSLSTWLTESNQSALDGASSPNSGAWVEQGVFEHTPSRNEKSSQLEVEGTNASFDPFQDFDGLHISNSQEIFASTPDPFMADESFSPIHWDKGIEI